MVQRFPGGYVFDPDDPRAPSEEQWAQMTPEERDRVVDMLPAEVPLELLPPEGDDHWNAKVSARQSLESFFRRIGRKVYVSSELAVFYPDEPRFAPDVLAVLDVERHARTKWLVEREGKGLDFVLEVHVAGDTTKDFVTNVERYARLGIHEYFIFDRGRMSLRGYRLPPTDKDQPNKARAYRPIVPQGGRYASEVLGLELTLEGSRLRFYYGMAALPEADELIAKLGTMLDEVLVHKEDEARRAAELEKQLVERDQQLAEAQAEIERLKRERG